MPMIDLLFHRINGLDYRLLNGWLLCCVCVRVRRLALCILSHGLLELRLVPGDGLMSFKEISL